MQSLLALCNLKNFIKAVDKFETNIEDNVRIEYRRKYMKLIDDLKDTLDEERILLIQKRKDILKNVQRILDCTDEKQRLSKWCELDRLYAETEERRSQYQLLHPPRCQRETGRVLRRCRTYLYNGYRAYSGKYMADKESASEGGNKADTTR